MRKYYKYELNMSIMNILSVVLFVGFLAIISINGYDITENINYSFYIIGIIFYLIFHEVLHGLGYSFFAKDKKNIKFGIALEKGVLYAACQEPLNKKQILISLMLPTLLLSVIALPVGLIFNLNWLVIFSIINLGGSIADILMMILVIRAPKDVAYLDYNTDIGVYLISECDMSNLKSFGFILTDQGQENKKEIDKSIKRFYISKYSCIILAIVFLICIIL